MEQIVKFKSEEKEVFGILHTPTQSIQQSKVGIIVARYRTGPHRMFVEAARRWNNEGFHVLRIDFPGMGDSEGEYLYRHIDDFPRRTLLDAIQYFKEREKVEKVVLVGVCSGARTVLYTAGECPEVQHLILMAMPFTSVSYDYQEIALLKKNAHISSASAKGILTNYLKLLIKPNNWKRLLSGQSQFSLHFLITLINSLLKRNNNQLFQKQVYTSMRMFFERQGRALFIYGGGDEVTKDFTEEFQLVKSTIQGVDLLSEIFIIEGANHVFSRVEWKTNAIKYTSAWLHRQFPIQCKEDLLRYNEKDIKSLSENLL